MQSLVTSLITVVLTSFTLIGSGFIATWFAFERWTYIQHKGGKSFWEVAQDLFSHPATPQGSGKQFPYPPDTTTKPLKKGNTVIDLSQAIFEHATPSLRIFTSATAEAVDQHTALKDESAILYLQFSPCRKHLVTSRY